MRVKMSWDCSSLRVNVATLPSPAAHSQQLDHVSEVALRRHDPVLAVDNHGHATTLLLGAGFAVGDPADPVLVVAPGDPFRLAQITLLRVLNLDPLKQPAESHVGERGKPAAISDNFPSLGRWNLSELRQHKRGNEPRSVPAGHAGDQHPVPTFASPNCPLNCVEHRRELLLVKPSRIVVKRSVDDIDAGEGAGWRLPLFCAKNQARETGSSEHGSCRSLAANPELGCNSSCVYGLVVALDQAAT